LIGGAVWGLFNAGLVVLFAFGPTLLIETGWNEATAGTVTSLLLWMIALVSPFGGRAADLAGRPEPVICAGLAALAVAIVLTPVMPWPVFWFIAMGLAAGVVPGAIMSLPIAYLTPNNRGLGMGIFFGVYYVAIFVSPILAGAVAERSGSTAMAFVTGAALTIGALICTLWNQRFRQA